MVERTAPGERTGGVSITSRGALDRRGAPAEIEAHSKAIGLVPKGPEPINGKGAYVDPATNAARIEIHPKDNLGQPPHAHVYNEQGELVAADGSIAPTRESTEAHLPLKFPCGFTNDIGQGLHWFRTA